MQRVKRQIRYHEKDVKNTDAFSVAVLDSGVSMHPDFLMEKIVFRDFVNYRNWPYDDNGHGTHICGIIAGSGAASGGIYKGIVPGNPLVVGKVLDQKGDGNAQVMMRGLDWILKNREKYHIRVLNISVGLNKVKEKEKITMLKEKLDQLWWEGVAVVCAAGNDGPSDNSISPLALGKNVIGVGCYDLEYPGHCVNCSQYSGRGNPTSFDRKPDVVAPGTEVISCGSGKLHQYYVKKSGTSMATAVVSGALMAALNRYPHLSNDDLKQGLTDTARNLKVSQNLQGWGMLDIDKLLHYYKT